MKKVPFLLLSSLIFISVLTSCSRSQNQFMDDTRSASRHMKRGVYALGGKHGESKMIHSRDEFYNETAYCYKAPDDFVPLADYETSEIAMADYVVPAAAESPGDPGSRVPGIDSFEDPSSNPYLARIFRNLQFPFDSSLIKGESNLNSIRDIAQYMRRNPNVYVFVEGHCDERGPEAYNLALGARRANAVRNMLIKEGVNPDNIFTISQGKEKPLVFGHNENAWSQNRRAEFKVYHHG